MSHKIFLYATNLLRRLCEYGHCFLPCSLFSAPEVIYCYLHFNSSHIYFFLIFYQSLKARIIWFNFTKLVAVRRLQKASPFAKSELNFFICKTTQLLDLLSTTKRWRNQIFKTENACWLAWGQLLKILSRPFCFVYVSSDLKTY